MVVKYQVVPEITHTHIRLNLYNYACICAVIIKRKEAISLRGSGKGLGKVLREEMEGVNDVIF